MWTRKPLPADVEAALDTLDTTQNLADGDAAKAIAVAYFKKFQWLSWLGAIPVVLGLIALAVRDQPWDGPLALFAAALGVANIFFVQERRVHVSLDRFEEAMNRWRQIAGTLAVSGKAQ